MSFKKESFLVGGLSGYLAQGDPKKVASVWQDAFLDELEKIAESEGASTRELIQELTPRPKGFAERALPVTGTIGGTMGGASLARYLAPSAGGWKGHALRGVAGAAGGLTGLGVGAAGQKALIRDRRLDAYKQLMGVQE